MAERELESRTYKVVWLDEASRVPWEELKRANRRYEEAREKAERWAMYRRCARYFLKSVLEGLLQGVLLGLLFGIVLILAVELVYYLRVVL